MRTTRPAVADGLSSAPQDAWSATSTSTTATIQASSANAPDFFNSLLEDKDAIRRAAETSYQTLGSVMDRSFDAQLDELRKAGASVRILKIPMKRSVRGTVTKYREVQTAWAEEQKSKGQGG